MGHQLKNKLPKSITMLSFEQLKQEILSSKASSEYKQAAIIIIRGIFEPKQ